MTDLPESYPLETVEQLRGIADELRQRIYTVLAEQPMTVTQVGQRLGVAPAKIHYHVRELERLGLVHLHETREKGGILEKYYRPVARYIDVPRSLLQSMSPDEHLDAFSGLLSEVARAFMTAVSAASEDQELRGLASLARTHVWLTDEEFAQVARAVEEAFEPYTSPRGIEGERERSLVQIMYDTRAAWADLGGEESPGDVAMPRIRRTVLAGKASWNRKELERLLARGERLDVNVLGLVSFAHDVSADLVDRAIIRFWHRGVINASPAIKAVLAKKSTGLFGESK